MCVCVLKKDDIFINWSLWSVVGPIVLPHLWFEYGLSSNQIRTNDVRNVVLLVVDPSSIHHYIFWSDQCYHFAHIVMGFHLYGNLDELLLSPSAAYLSSPWICWTLKLVLESFVSIIFMSQNDIGHIMLLFDCMWCLSCLYILFA